MDVARARLGIPRPIRRSKFTAQSASAEWDAGVWDYLSGIGELARYGILAAFARRLGGDTASILDVGCGEGLLREHIATFGRYVGVDVAPAAIGRARERWEDARTTFVTGDISSVAGPFEVVILNEVLQVVPDPEDILVRAERVLTSNGSLLVSLHRHVDNRLIWPMIDRRFERVEVVQVRSTKSRHTWRVACYRRRETPHLPPAETPSGGPDLGPNDPE